MLMKFVLLSLDFKFTLGFLKQLEIWNTGKRTKEENSWRMLWWNYVRAIERHCIEIRYWQQLKGKKQTLGAFRIHDRETNCIKCDECRCWSKKCPMQLNIVTV